MPRLALALALAFAPRLAAAAPAPSPPPLHRLAADDPAWRDLLDQFRHRNATAADFEEQRWFPFKKLPVVLKGEVRVSASRGLSLDYTDPAPERVVIIDGRGLLLREAARDTAPPSDPRAAATDAALLGLLHFDLPALDRDFELYGSRSGEAWTLALVPRAEALRRVLGQITVVGTGVDIAHIELRRAANQRVEIAVAPSRPRAFTADELRRYFR